MRNAEGSRYNIKKESYSLNITIKTPAAYNKELVN